MTTTDPPQEWYRDQYMVSTSQTLLQPAAVNAAFASPALYWTHGLDDSLMKRMLSNSLCFGVYLLPQSSLEIAGKAIPQQIGLARLVTDHATFAYLTDVYILADHQKKGLGSWLLTCVDEVISSWPELRRLLLISQEGPSSKLYEEKLGMKPFQGGKLDLKIFNRKGNGAMPGV